MPDTPLRNARGPLRYLQKLALLAYLRDPLRNNAVFLIATSAASALIGFFFWTLAARLYPVADVGRATAMVSAGTMLCMLSGLGMGMGIIRFLAEQKNKNLLINTAFTIVAVTALVLSIIFLLGLGFWSPALGFIHDSYLLIAVFVLYTVFNSLFGLQSSTFVAFRAAHLSLYQALIVALKIGLLALLVYMGTGGIFTAYTLAVLIAFVAANFFIRRLHPQYRLEPTFDIAILKNIFHFTSGNYIGDVFKSLTAVIMPLIVINVLGAEQNAYFYISWMIAALFFTVAYAVNISLVAETSHQTGEMRRQVFKALRFVFIILVPAIVIVYFLGGFLLSFFGVQYATEGLWLLRILIISSIPVAVNETYVALFRIRKRVRPIMLIYGLISLFTIVGGYMLLGVLGLNGIGIAWLCAHVITAIVIIVLNFKHMVNHKTVLT